MDGNCLGNHRTSQEVSILACHSLKDNPLRTNYYDESHIEHLIHSIKENGLLEPLIVWRPEETRPLVFQILSGHYRIRACRRLGIPEVPCQVWTGDEEGAWKVYCSASLCSRTPHPLEQAYIILKLKDKGKSYTEIGRLMGHTKSWVSKRLKLLTSLDPVIFRRLETGTIRPRLAEELTKLPQENGEQNRVLKILEREKMTKDEASAFIHWWNNASPKEREEAEKRDVMNTQEKEQRHLSRMLKNNTIALKSIANYVERAKLSAESWPKEEWEELYIAVQQLSSIIGKLNKGPN